MDEVVLKGKILKLMLLLRAFTELVVRMLKILHRSCCFDTGAGKPGVADVLKWDRKQRDYLEYSQFTLYRELKVRPWRYYNTNHTFLSLKCQMCAPRKRVMTAVDASFSAFREFLREVIIFKRAEERFALINTHDDSNTRR